MTTIHGVERPDNIEGVRSPEQIQRELGDTRSRIDNDLDELDDRFGTGDAIKEAATHMRDSAAAFGSNVGRVLRDNPVPALLIGAGAAWIAMSALSRTQRGQELRRRVENGAHDVAQSTAERAGTIRDKAGEVAGKAREHAQNLGQRAQHLGQRAQQGASEVGHRASDAFESQPLLIGALGLAIGAAIGASIPSTRRENELVGPLRDRLKDEVVDYGRDQVARAGDAAHEAIESARKETRKALDAATEELADTPKQNGKAGSPTTTAAKPAS